LERRRPRRIEGYASPQRRGARRRMSGSFLGRAVPSQFWPSGRTGRRTRSSIAPLSYGRNSRALGGGGFRRDSGDRPVAIEGLVVGILRNLGSRGSRGRYRTYDSDLSEGGGPKYSNVGPDDRVVTSFGDARRVAAAHKDLTRLVGTDVRVGLVLLDDDQRELPPIEGQVVRIGPGSLLFRHDGLDEELSLATISKRIENGDVLAY
jgi:hypothetical protein